MSAPESVDDYIASASGAAQPLLRALRETIRGAAPEADERISYGMPAYDQNGRVAYFQANKHHVGLYSFNLDDARAVGLEQHMAAKSTLQFRFDQPLPLEAIRRLIEERVRANTARAGVRTSDT